MAVQLEEAVAPVVVFSGQCWVCGIAGCLPHLVSLSAGSVSCSTYPL